MTFELVGLSVTSEPDVFAARQLAREAAAAVGMDVNDQVRVATAVSELGRVIIAARGSAHIALSVVPGVRPELLIAVVADDSFAIEGPATSNAGLEAGRRLMDSLCVVAERPWKIHMSKALPPGRWPLDVYEIEALRAQLARSVVSSPLDELRAQNLELLTALEQLRAKQDELVRLNEELAETNQGVMAMYSQLSTELEETNRGVVALYAELDERGVQLHHASEAKSRFLASVSHELRSPLNSIRGLAQLLQEPDSDSLTESQAYQIKLISSSTDELLALVNGLLDLAKAESGKLAPQPTIVRLDVVLAELQATMRPLIHGGVDLDIDIPEGVCDLETDATLLAQVLRNLLTNALKFTDQGTVRVRSATSASASQVAITVEDTGIGIAPEHQELVFEEFFQVPGPLQARSKNSGLGLPYARRVTEALGGSLSIASEVGVGSTFTVTLPMRWIAIPDVSAATTNADTETTILDTVLIVDDEPSFRELLRQMLQGSVGRVVEAEDGPGALDLMRRIGPDLVLLDLRMAGGGGEDVLAQASSDSVLRSVPIAVVTSVAVDDAALRLLSPAFTILNKSDLTKQSLLATVRSALSTDQR